MQWFGEPWNPLCCVPERRVSVPHGRTCAVCAKPFRADAQGVELLGYEPDAQGWAIECFHLECFLRLMLPPSPPTQESPACPTSTTKQPPSD